jgi:hypothetical protein
MRKKWVKWSEDFIIKPGHDIKGVLFKYFLDIKMQSVYSSFPNYRVVVPSAKVHDTNAQRSHAPKGHFYTLVIWDFEQQNDNLIRKYE